MDTMQAFMMGQANRDKPLMVFDWEKAAILINERQPTIAAAGLESDWEWTGGDIYRNGEPIPSDDTYTFLASTWATPQLDLDGDLISCYIMQYDVPEEWGDNYAHIYWPKSALNILKESK